MRVFVMGGTGFLGSAIVEALLDAGHEVTVLSRNPANATALAERGADLVRGDMKQPDSYRKAAGGQDAWLHLAFEYTQQTVTADRAAVDGLVDVARAGKGPRQVVYTSGIWVLGDTGGRPADESASTANAAPLVAWRPAHEQIVLRAAAGDLVTAVVRPGLVYGGSGGLTAKLFETAQKTGEAVVVGDGNNRWSMVHRDDLGGFYRALLERRAGGVFHAVDGASLTAAEVGRAAARAAGSTEAVRFVPVDEARAKLGPVADAICLDQIVVTKRAAVLGWKPECASFEKCAVRAFREWQAATTKRASR